MKIVLFVEGPTERSIPELLKRWLDPQLAQPIGIKAVCLDGWSNYVKEIAASVALNFSRVKDAIGAVGLLDLYGPTFYPASVTTVARRYEWAKADLETRVNQARFRQHFAVHETEAWLLAEPAILPAAIRRSVEKRGHPEQINFDEPPSRLLNNLYRKYLDRNYKKTIDGANLFINLSPQRVYDTCAHFRLLADDMLRLARSA